MMMIATNPPTARAVLSVIIDSTRLARTLTPPRFRREGTGPGV
jgi:hypothetical protein